MTWQNNTSLDSIVRALGIYGDQHASLHGWVLEAKSSESCQALLRERHENELSVYQDRHVIDNSFSLELYFPSTDKKAMGTAKGSIDPAFDLNAQFDSLLANAQLAENPYFELPDAPTEAYADIQAADPTILNSLVETHLQLTERVTKHCLTLNGVYVNSAELFTNKHNQLYLTSKGIRAEQQSTDIYFEVAMEKAPRPNTQEVLKYWHFIGLNDADFETHLDAVAREALLTDDAQVPATNNSAAVLIDSYAISKLIAAITSQLQGSAEFSKGPHLKAGDKVNNNGLQEHSDTLTVSIDPTVPQMAKTAAFTEDGLIATKATVIKNNNVVTQILGSRMAQYLERDANNISGNFVVNLGAKTKDELLNGVDEVVELIDLSSLLVNPASLTWSSEIKLGLLHKKGQSPTLLKGGIVSGNVKDNLAAFQFSNRESKRNTTGGYFEAAHGYVGPEHMLIWNGVTIAGQEE